VTVVRRKLEQSALRAVRGRRPSRVPVTARLQLFPAQARFSTTEPKAREARDRITAAFILTALKIDWFVDVERRDLGILDLGCWIYAVHVDRFEVVGDDSERRTDGNGTVGVGWYMVYLYIILLSLSPSLSLFLSLSLSLSLSFGGIKLGRTAINHVGSGAAPPKACSNNDPVQLDSLLWRMIKEDTGVQGALSYNRKLQGIPWQEEGKYG
jgi:hypothetical protein